MKKRNLLLSILASSFLLFGCNKKINFVLALGGEGVPVGQYSTKILSYFGLNDDDVKTLEKKGAITYCQDVKAVTSQVTNNLVSAGIIYQTDAFSANLKVVDTATKEMCGQVIYPAAVINYSSKQQEAKSFLSYLQTKEAMDVFESVGFSKVSETYADEIKNSKSNNIELNIYAAASMTETLNEIKTKYETLYPNITLIMNYGSSGALQKQIEESAPKGEQLSNNGPDIFISAGQSQMNNIDKDGGTQTEKDLIDHSTRIDLLENKVALVTSKDNDSNIKSFDDLKSQLFDLLK